MCLENFSSQKVERHNKPEIEVKESLEVLLNPVIISRNEKEKVLVSGKPEPMPESVLASKDGPTLVTVRSQCVNADIYQKLSFLPLSIMV